MQIYWKLTPTKMCPCEINKTFKNAYFYKTSPVAASGNIKIKHPPPTLPSSV